MASRRDRKSIVFGSRYYDHKIVCFCDEKLEFFCSPSEHQIILHLNNHDAHRRLHKIIELSCHKRGGKSACYTTAALT